MIDGKQSIFKCTYNSGPQLAGHSILYPDLSNFNNALVGTLGYGLPPNVTISHKRIPNDHLEEHMFH